jgi:hypothetical protein
VLVGVTIFQKSFQMVDDCHHAVELDFSLDSPEDRKESLTKIDILAEVVNRFREALHTEAQAIKSAKKAQ